MLRTPTILYPTDFSSYSNQAYLHAVALAESHRATLTVVYVAQPEPNSDHDFWRGQLTQIRPANPAIPVKHVLLEGDPATEIVSYARDAGFDLIVMGTHGRTGIERQLMGSVAEKILREAPCSVLVVKLPRAFARAEQADEAHLAKG
ncbi:MAG: universal stress protein [Gemmataceae bacterium]|nr:universal stress protein [Gemmataceae bacterium]